jgi:hypothetical protein
MADGRGGEREREEEEEGLREGAASDFTILARKKKERLW